MKAINFMNSTVSKLALSLVFAASLAACGGGDSVAPVVTLDAPAVTVGTSAAAVTAAKATVAALVGTTVTLPALTSKEGTAVVAGTKLTFTPIPTGAAANTLSGVKLESPGKVEVGTLIPGSCIFRVTSLNGDTLTVPYNITFDPCSIDLTTNGLATTGGADQPVAVTISFAGNPVMTAVSVKVTVVNGQAVLTFTNGTTSTVGLTTGAAGS